MSKKNNDNINSYNGILHLIQTKNISKGRKIQRRKRNKKYVMKKIIFAASCFNYLLNSVNA